MKIELSHDLKLTGIPPDLRQELMKRLKFTNPKWIENERMGRWNKGVPRELRFYETLGRKGLRVPRGYLRQLILRCRHLNIPHHIDDQRHAPPPVALNFKGSLKPFQQTAVGVMLSRAFGTLCAPTGSGKTVMALHMIATRQLPTLVVVHTRELARQWEARAATFLGLEPEAVGRIGGGKRRVGAQLTVALVQTLYKCAEQVAPQIGFLIVDECHRTPSRTFTDTVSRFNCRYMLGLTATPWRRDQLSKLIFWYLGDMHHEVDKASLIDSGDVLSIEVVTRETRFEPYHDPVTEYSQMMSELTADDERNRLIAADVAKVARETQGICLVLSDRKKHCANLAALLRYKNNTPADLLTGDVPEAERKQVLKRLNNGDIQVLVATGQLVGEGFDCRQLTTLFIATPVRFSGRLIQYLGRILRPAPGKHSARVYDYVDVRVNVLVAAAQSRQRVYAGMRRGGEKAWSA